MTAVEWLIEQFNTVEFIYDDRSKILEQAKEMEKQQIIDACSTNYIDGDFIERAINNNNSIGEQYYNETFKNK